MGGVNEPRRLGPRARALAVGLRLLRHVPRRLFWGAARLVYPTFSVGVVCLMLDDRLQILLVRSPYNRGWTVPGGFLKRGEQPREAGERELAEELDASGLRLAEVGANVRRQRRQIDFIYLARISGGAAGQLSSRSAEVEAMEWFSLDELPDLHPDAARFVDRLRRELTAPNRFDEALSDDELVQLRNWAER